MISFRRADLLDQFKDIPSEAVLVIFITLDGAGRDEKFTYEGWVTRSGIDGSELQVSDDITHRIQDAITKLINDSNLWASDVFLTVSRRPYNQIYNSMAQHRGYIDIVHHDRDHGFDFRYDLQEFLS